MSKDKEVLYSELSQAVLEMDEERSVHISGEIVAEQYDAYEAVVHGLADGMDKAGRLFEEEEYFIPELLMCSDAMYAGLEVLKPHLKREESGGRKRVVIGVVEGDTHDIGKNLVKIMLETSGFDVYDLGRDISPQKFVDKAKEVGAEIIAVSTLMTTTMDAMAAVVQLLHEEKIKDKIRVMVGGGPISQSFADKIGADGYAANAAGAVRLAKKLAGGA